ncbi:hypothetical protein L249_2264 [Ophiocordyceps polyrhachis-furcata BCC 54312]|uniref:Ribonuclease n=1 Tax=Ophiocordyceps polyrhachis-furcata BCC 54312 TaxID=1330021 RepID=A0A367LSG4_9HYPO|nr:hypothetical protein L249_2264 [Ophiocordyceps polyrhachis-furcata BCC 54312]
MDPFVPPSVHPSAITNGDSYTHTSPIPPSLHRTPCTLGIDEAGRGPVLGPMVYAAYFLPTTKSSSLLRERYKFDDSKVLTSTTRTELMREVCRSDSELGMSSGWAVAVLSARDISAGMWKGTSLNAMAFDATVGLIRSVCEEGVDVREIFVDAVGPPVPYQSRLQLLFPTARVVVANKADSLYPCVSAASVCAKVTRDSVLDQLFFTTTTTNTTTTRHSNPQQLRSKDDDDDDDDAQHLPTWGSGYPSDARCTTWLKTNLHPIFGWGSECRFSWATAKDLLEGDTAAKVDWPHAQAVNSRPLTEFFFSSEADGKDELASWFGSSVGVKAL